MKTVAVILFLVIGVFAGWIAIDGWLSRKDKSGGSLGPLVGPFFQYGGGVVAAIAFLAAACLYFF